MSTALTSALAVLRDEVTAAETRLADLGDASLADRFAAAGEVAVARLRESEVSSAIPGESARARVEVGAALLAELFDTTVETPQADDEDPLAALLA